MREIKQVPEKIVSAHLELPDGFLPEQYKPTIVENNGNKYVILNQYIAGNLRQLLEICHTLQFPFSSGDWWDDALLLIPKEWVGNSSVEYQVQNYNAWAAHKIPANLSAYDVDKTIKTLKELLTFLEAKKQKQHTA